MSWAAPENFSLQAAAILGVTVVERTFVCFAPGEPESARIVGCFSLWGDAILRATKILRTSMFRHILVLVMCLLSQFCLAVDGSKGRSSCSENSLDSLYSRYEIFEVVKYGGGLTAESSVKGRLGEKVIVERDTFQVRDLVISNPYYELACYPLPNEGEVDANRWSNFYGFGLNRTSIEVLHVYDEDDVTVEPSVNLELVNGQLWEMYDGWVYKMKPLKHQ